jgi:hypothetical protein
MATKHGEVLSWESVGNAGTETQAYVETHVCEVPGGVIVRCMTTVKNADYSVGNASVAMVFIPNVHAEFPEDECVLYQGARENA